MPLSDHSAHQTLSIIPRQGTWQWCQHSDSAMLSPVLVGGQKLSPWLMPRACTPLRWPLPMSWILLTMHRMPRMGGIWPLNPEPPNIPTSLLYNAELLANSLVPPLWRGNRRVIPCWSSTQRLAEVTLSRVGQWRLSDVSGRQRGHVYPPPSCSFSSLLTKITVVGEGLPRGQKILQDVSSRCPSFPHNLCPSPVCERRLLSKCSIIIFT